MHFYICGRLALDAKMNLSSCFTFPLDSVIGWLIKLVVSEEVLAGTEVPGGGGRGRLYPTLHCHHQNDFCS